MNVSEKAAHLKGLMEGMEYDLKSKEGKLFAAIADLLEDLALTVSDLEDEAATLGDYIEEIDEDLGEVEKAIFETEDDYDDYEDEDEDGCCCCGAEETYEVECDNCGEAVYLDGDELDDLESIICPSCGKPIESADKE